MVQVLHVLSWDGFVVIPILKTRQINTRFIQRLKPYSTCIKKKVYGYAKTSTLETHLLEAIILVTVGTVPAVPVPIGYHCVLITEPAVHICMDRLLPIKR